MGMGFLISSHFIYRRISYIMYRILMFRFKKLHFKGKYGEEFIHIAFDILDAILLPCPYLRRNIVENRNLSPGMYKLSYVKIETGIVYQNHDIRIPANNILLATFHIRKDRTQMKQHGDKSHICQFFIMLHHRPSDGSHQISTEKTEISLRIFRLQGSHQMRRV